MVKQANPKHEESIHSTLGILTAHNSRGGLMPLIALKRWLRYTRLVLDAKKVDVLVNGATTPIVESLFDCARELNCRLGLRTDAKGPIPDLALWKSQGLRAATLCPKDLNEASFLSWLRACTSHDIPVYLVLPLDCPIDGLVKLVEKHLQCIRSISFATTDPFFAFTLGQINFDNFSTVIQSLAKNGIHIEIHDIPYCALDKSLWPLIVNSAQRRLEHLSYIPTSETLAKSIYNHRIFIGSKIIRMVLKRHTLHKTPVDEILLPFVLKRSYRYVINRFIRRLTEHLNIAGSVPRERRPSHYDLVLDDLKKTEIQPTPADCSACSLARICDKHTTTLPSFNAKAIQGEPIVAPMQFRKKAYRYFDDDDVARIAQQSPDSELVSEAHRILSQVSPTHLLSSDDYSDEDSFSESMEGGVKWWSVSNCEKRSTPLGEFSLPLTIEVEVGAGIADFIGFSFGKHIKIVCPMEAYRHTLTIHISAKGEYLLLRDGTPVPPTRFDGLHHLPTRLSDRLQPRLSFWNIDDCLLTQGLRIWQGEPSKIIEEKINKYSIIIVSTMFSRRLQAVLQNIAHQQNIDLSQLEIIVAYVPGLDATDDLIDTINLTYPHLNIVRSTYAEKQRNSKGLMINESFKLAKGEWIMLLDSDILLPPDYFARIEAVSDEEQFIAPDGRRLLTPETTAKVLLGDIRPWDDWVNLIEDSGEFRHRETQGIPVGFCQCFKAELLEKHPYIELEHFETADMEFGIKMKQEIGQEHRLSGAPVLHLDHNGSQWYGTRRHM